MHRALPKIAVGTHRADSTRSESGNDVGQGTFATVVASDVAERRRQLREIFRTALSSAGTYEWLAKAIGREESYGSKIRDAANGIDGRNVQLEWLAPVLLDPSGAKHFLSELCPLLGYEIPNRIAAPSPDNLVGPMIDRFDRMGEPGEQAIVLRRACGR